jgi:AraC family transcriptional regulator
MHQHFSMIRSLIDEIEQNLAFEVNIPELASTFNVSPWHFQRLFKSIVGDSLGGYIRGRRLTRAAQSLLASKETIMTIAVDVGFSTHESFTRSFKSYFKVSPKQFRAQRPSVVLNEKPLLTPELFDHIIDGMDLNPEILDLPELTIVGMETQVTSPFTTVDPICNMVGETWMELLDRQGEIKHSLENSLYALTISESGLFTEDLLRYIAGVPVTELGTLPKGMTSFTLPKRKVAIFDTQTNVDADVARRTIDVIYGYWFANQPYTRGIGTDYELFVNLRDPMKGDFDSKYVIPIVG